MMLETIIQALLIAAITAAATGYVNSRIMASKLDDLRERLARIEIDLRERISRIENYLDGLLRKSDK